MKKAIISAFLMIVCSIAYADKVRVYTDYAPVRIAVDSDNEAAKSGLSGSFKTIDRSALPKDKLERNFWKMTNGQIKTDKTLKDEEESKQSKKQNDKMSAISKLKALGFSDDELAALKIGDNK